MLATAYPVHGFVRQPNIDSRAPVKPIEDARQIDVWPLKPRQVNIRPLKCAPGEVCEDFSFHCSVVAGFARSVMN